MCIEPVNGEALKRFSSHEPMSGIFLAEWI